MSAIGQTKASLGRYIGFFVVSFLVVSMLELATTPAYWSGTLAYVMTPLAEFARLDPVMPWGMSFVVCLIVGSAFRIWSQSVLAGLLCTVVGALLLPVIAAVPDMILACTLTAQC